MFKYKNKVFKIPKDWARISKSLKKLYPLLKDEDLKYELGNEESILKSISIKTGKNRNDVVTLIQKIHRKWVL